MKTINEYLNTNINEGLNYASIKKEEDYHKSLSLLAKVINELESSPYYQNDRADNDSLFMDLFYALAEEQQWVKDDFDKKLKTYIESDWHKKENCKVEEK